MERWNPFILKGVLTPETQSWQHLSAAAFNNMVIVLLIRILLHIWHPCYVLIEQRIIFWHIFYEITTAINLITIIFFAHFCLSVVCAGVDRLSCGYCQSCTRSLDGLVHDPNRRDGNGRQYTLHGLTSTPLFSFSLPSFCSREWYHY